MHLIQIYIEDTAGRFVYKIAGETPPSARKQLTRIARDLNAFFAAHQLQFCAKVERELV